MSEQYIEAIAKAISALGHLAWPVGLFGTLCLFRREISNILQRLRKGKLFGQEIELESLIEDLRHKGELFSTSANAPLREFTTQSQGATIVQLEGLIEAELRAIAKLRGIELSHVAPYTKLISELQPSNTLSPEIVSALQAFFEVRDLVSNGANLPADDSRAAIVGESLLIALRDIRVAYE
ncbi:hypothetical protein [Steroidobacter sp.]|uniref:hypothetical protein n=1 Tax=Steroidobacter sp. TaxID=1978227 RepID=UPI001A5E2158|nr:hypothetical protein [Steroidobacter sp.]MBL8271207.1 hypothetical protein [Steroidobacter sp.]